MLLFSKESVPSLICLKHKLSNLIIMLILWDLPSAIENSCLLEDLDAVNAPVELLEDFDVEDL